MNREPGYYWVKNEGEWVIAKWDVYRQKSYRWRFGTYIKLHRMEDSDFDEIDERRIERNPNDISDDWKQKVRDIGEFLKPRS